MCILVWVLEKAKGARYPGARGTGTCGPPSMGAPNHCAISSGPFYLVSEIGASSLHFLNAGILGIFHHTWMSTYIFLKQVEKGQETTL